MGSRGGIELAADEEREGRELEGVEVVVSWEKMRWIACAEAVGEFGERVAVAEESILYLSVIDSRKGVEDGFNFPDAMMNGVAREGNVANRRTEQHKAVFGGARNATFKRVVVRRRGAAPNQRFERI